MIEDYDALFDAFMVERCEALVDELIGRLNRMSNAALVESTLERIISDVVSKSPQTVKVFVDIDPSRLEFHWASMSVKSTRKRRTGTKLKEAE